MPSEAEGLNTTQRSSSININSSTDSPKSEATRDALVMQIIVRRDLLNEEGWGYGPLMSQTAHAAVAVLHETRDRRETIDYLADLKNMHKVVLQIADLPSLFKLASLLSSPTSSSPSSSQTSSSNSDPSSEVPIPYHLWIEQPENIPTCIALAPNKREKAIRRALDKCSCRLWKG